MGISTSSTSAATYDSLLTYTLPSNTSTYTLSGFPSTYTDLVLTIKGGNVTGQNGFYIYFNGDTSNTKYIWADFNADLSSATCEHNAAEIGISATLSDNSLSSFGYINIFSYANTTTWKTICSQANTSNWLQRAYWGAWKDTSAITSITVKNGPSSYNMASGTIFALYGIKEA